MAFEGEDTTINIIDSRGINCDAIITWLQRIVKVWQGVEVVEQCYFN